MNNMVSVTPYRYGDHLNSARYCAAVLNALSDERYIQTGYISDMDVLYTLEVMKDVLKFVMRDGLEDEVEDDMEILDLGWDSALPALIVAVGDMRVLYAESGDETLTLLYAAEAGQDVLHLLSRWQFFLSKPCILHDLHFETLGVKGGWMVEGAHYRYANCVGQRVTHRLYLPTTYGHFTELANEWLGSLSHEAQLNAGFMVAVGDIAILLLNWLMSPPGDDDVYQHVAHRLDITVEQARSCFSVLISVLEMYVTLPIELRVRLTRYDREEARRKTVGLLLWGFRNAGKGMDWLIPQENHDELLRGAFDYSYPPEVTRVKYNKSKIDYNPEIRQEVMQRWCEGVSVDYIAGEAGLSPNTVRQYIAHMWVRMKEVAGCVPYVRNDVLDKALIYQRAYVRDPLIFYQRFNDQTLEPIYR